MRVDQINVIARPAHRRKLGDDRAAGRAQHVRAVIFAHQQRLQGRPVQDQPDALDASHLAPLGEAHLAHVVELGLAGYRTIGLIELQQNPLASER